MKTDAVAMTLLYDYYGELLTEKQQSCLDLYYNQDYSLTEIAEEQGVSRQGVHDSITRAEQALLEYERRLGCVARAKKVQDALEEASRAAEEILRCSGGDKACSLANTILRILDTVKE